MLRTLFSLKCGSSDFLARRKDVKWEKNLAYRNLCLKVLSATVSRKKKRDPSTRRSSRPIRITYLSLSIYLQKQLADPSIQSVENSRSNHLRVIYEVKIILGATLFKRGSQMIWTYTKGCSQLRTENGITYCSCFHRIIKLIRGLILSFGNDVR